jgi:DNA-binding transcriptional MerR regulator
VNIRELVIQETLPKKSLFNIHEVSSLLKVKPHEIRYWENEFPQIRSQKNKHGQRLYRKEDVVLFTAVKHLLHDKKFTIAGALKVLADSDLLEQRLASEPETEVVAQALPINAGSNLHHEILQASCELLPEPEIAFDEQTHEIYQSCAQDLDTVEIKLEAHHVGEMIADALTEHQNQEQKASTLSKIEHEKALATLLASKTQLNELLVSLEKFAPNDFWGDFKNKK